MGRSAWREAPQANGRGRVGLGLSQIGADWLQLHCPAPALAWEARYIMRIESDMHLSSVSGAGGVAAVSSGDAA